MTNKITTLESREIDLHDGSGKTTKVYTYKIKRGRVTLQLSAQEDKDKAILAVINRTLDAVADVVADIKVGG